MRRLISVMRYLRRSRAEQDLHEELREHIERQTEFHMRSGMSEAEARRTALREFGGLAQIEEECRQARTGHLVAAVFRDIRFGLRMLLRERSFTAVAVATLALGIGTNAAIFSLLHAAVLKRLPYPEPAQLVTLQAVLDQPGRGQFSFGWSYPKFVDLRNLTTRFEGMAGMTPHAFTMTGAGDPERIDGEIVTGSYFDVLRVRALLGRTFLPEEDRTANTHPVVILSEGLWRRKFGARSEAIGSTVHISQLPFTIIGVMPGWFAGESGRAELWAPVMMMPAITDVPKQLEMRMAHRLVAFGRVRPGVSVEQASADFDDAVRRMEATHPSSPGTKENWGGRVVSMEAAKKDPVLGRALWILFGAVGFVLLIACINVATLLLSRSIVRRREMAIRLAIGAGRGSLVRQLLTESLLLAIAGGAAGLLFASGTLQLLARLNAQVGDPGNQPAIGRLNLETLTLDWTVFAFAAGVSLLTGVLFGLVPALQASRPDPGAAMKTAGGIESERPGRFGIRSALVTVQVALAVVLVAGAALMGTSLARLLNKPLGFQPDNLFTFRLSLPTQKYDSAGIQRFHNEMLARLRTLPGVESAAIASTLPLSGQNATTSAMIDGVADVQEARMHVVSPDYFSACAIPLLRGRLVSDADREGRPHVVVISESVARRYWPDQNPVGHRITFRLNGWSKPEEAAEIIGVVGDVKYRRLDTPADMDFYLSTGQRPIASAFAVLRERPGTRIQAGLIRESVRDLDAMLPVYALRSMKEILADSASVPRFNGVLMSLFAILATALASIGIFGMVSYAVTARTREMGVRAALGATGRQLTASAMTSGFRAAIFGLMLGIPLAIAASRFLRGLLYEVRDGDPATMLGVALLILVVTLLACYLPARRAASVDPARALRNE